MRIGRVSIKNFRCFEDFVIDLSGESRFLIGENAIGKSSILNALAKAFGRDRGFQQSDFLNIQNAIDIQVTLTGLDNSQLGTYAEAADFGSTTSLTVGVMATWDPEAEECEVTHGYPTKGWKQSNRLEREAIDVHWISDSREPSRLLQFGSRYGVLSDLLSTINLDAPITTALEEMRAACADLAKSPELQGLMDSASVELGKMVPAVSAQAYGVESSAATDSAAMRQMQLTLQYGGPQLPLTGQSSGLSQLTLFAFSLLAVAKKPGAILLLDEPEVSLHPQCQRALLGLVKSLPNQSIIATHSPSLLDRADPRLIARLFRNGGKVQSARPVTLSNEEAAHLARFTTPQNAEGFFARTVILVEGVSDKYALEALALKKARNLDAEGVTIVAMEGAGGIKTFLSLLGPKGLCVELVGMCDASDEAKWADALAANGLGINLDRAAMAAIGFFVCDQDLEDVLLTAVGHQDTLALIDAQGESAAFTTFSMQPTQSAKALQDRLRDFLHSRGRQIRYAPLLVDRLDLQKLPAPLEGVINAA